MCIFVIYIRQKACRNSAVCYSYSKMKNVKQIEHTSRWRTNDHAYNMTMHVKHKCIHYPCRYMHCTTDDTVHACILKHLTSRYNCDVKVLDQHTNGEATTNLASRETKFPLVLLNFISYFG